MAYPIERKLVVGVSSNALFDLRYEEDLFRNQGLERYREYQIKNKDKILERGAAFPFVRRLLAINEVYQEEVPVEVVLLSKNSPETGIRIYNSIKYYKLGITRGMFSSGETPFKYIPAYNIALFLSDNDDDVNNAVAANMPAGRFVNVGEYRDEGDNTLIVALDFDGVIANDESEKVYQERGIEEYYKYETEKVSVPHNPGPLAEFFRKLSFFQQLENRKMESDSSYNKLVKTAIVTARNAPAHERAINTLSSWGVKVDMMFMLGGVEKRRILEVLRPHIFIDDQMTHLDSNMLDIPLVHIPFGVVNTRG